MSFSTASQLKAVFADGAHPTSADFGRLVDTVFTLHDDMVAKATGQAARQMIPGEKWCVMTCSQERTSQDDNALWTLESKGVPGDAYLGWANWASGGTYNDVLMLKFYSPFCPVPPVDIWPYWGLDWTYLDINNYMWVFWMLPAWNGGLLGTRARLGQRITFVAL